LPPGFKALCSEFLADLSPFSLEKKMERAFEQQEGYRTSPNRRGTGVASIWCGEEEEAGRLRWTDHSTNGGRGGEDRIGKGK
jgi:hypothetical protein